MAAATGRPLGRLAPSTSVLFCCDIQEKFRPVIAGFPTVVDTAKRMVRGASILSMPVVVTEQYPKALGTTVSELVEVLPAGCSRHSKTSFSMMVPEVKDLLKKMPEVKQVLLVGLETHVCVAQTTLDLLAQGYEVHLLVDGLSSQRPHDRAVALNRLAQSGALLSTSEMALFDLMRDAKHPQFRAVSALVKEQRPDLGSMMASGL